VSLHASRFHDASREPVLDTNIAPYLDDNTQLSIGQYRDKLYESIIQKREELRALTQLREKGEEREGERSRGEERSREGERSRGEERLREGERSRGEEGVKEESPSPHRVLVTSPHTKPSSSPTSHKTPLPRHKSAPSHSRRANSAKRKVSHEGLVTAANF